MSTNTLDAFLAGGGKTAKFESVGTSYEGTVASAEIRQATNFDTGAPDFWPDGNPKQQIVISLETAERENADDDGVRSVYIKGWGDQRKALQAASKAAGGSPAAGDHFKVTYVGDGEKPQRGFAPKIYKYEIRKANPLDATLNAGAPAAPVQQAPAQAAMPATPVAQPGGGALTPQQEAMIQALIPKALSDEQIAAVVDGASPQAIAQVRLQSAAATSGGL